MSDCAGDAGLLRAATSKEKKCGIKSSCIKHTKAIVRIRVRVRG